MRCTFLRRMPEDARNGARVVSNASTAHFMAFGGCSPRDCTAPHGRICLRKQRSVNRLTGPQGTPQKVGTPGGSVESPPPLSYR